MALTQTILSVLARCVLLSGLGSVAAVHAQNITQIATGSTHNLFIREDGRLWSFGGNWAGQLGDGTKLERSAPVAAVVETVKFVASGSDHSLALANDGRVLAWGRNDSCQIGSNYPTYTPLASVVSGLPRAISQLAAGSTHSAALDDQGGVWMWGGNSFGELSLSSGSGTCTPVKVGGLPQVRRIWATPRSTFALAVDGSLWSWGDNSFSSLGRSAPAISSTPGKVLISERLIAATGAHSGVPINGAALDANGGVWLWGRNVDGTVRWDGSAGAIFDSPKRLLTVVGAISIHMTERSLFVISSSGEFRQYQRSDAGLVLARSLSGVAAMSAGSAHVVYIGTDKRLYALGANDSGQLGDAAVISVLVPRKIPISETVSRVAAGYYTGWAVTASGALYSWGEGSPTPKRVASSGYRDGCVSGSGFFLGITTTGGLNQVTSNSAISALIGEQVNEVACGHAHQIASVGGSSPRLASWGWNADGQLGNGTRVDAATPSTVATTRLLGSLSAGYHFSAGLDATGQQYSWGNNVYGVFGSGNTTSALVPTASTSVRRFVSLAAGYGHMLGLDSSGGLWAWGDDSFASLGTGTRQSFSSPQRIDGLDALSAIAAGYGHSAAVTTSGEVYSWGSSPGSGTGGDSLSPTRSVWLTGIGRLSARGDHTFALTRTGQVFGWGRNSSGQMGIAGPQDSANVVEVQDSALPSVNAGTYPVVEYANKLIEGGRYFISNQMEETKAIDGIGAAGGFERTGRAWRAWPTVAEVPPGVSAKPVYRFYVPGPNSHFYTVSTPERDQLINYNASLTPKVHQFEGAKFYAIEPITTGTGAGATKSCPTNTYPVYRAFNNKAAVNQGNHRITSNYIDIFRGLRFFGWTDEGIAFCSPVSSISGGDLQAYHTYPGDSVNAGDRMTAECIFNNAGPGHAHGATIHCALPPQVEWALTCVAKHGALCPASDASGDGGSGEQGGDGSVTSAASAVLTQNNLREGINLTSFPAGGVVTITAKATAPNRSTELFYASAIAAPGGAPDPVTSNNISAGLSKTVVKSVSDCIVSLSTNHLSAAARDTQARQISIKAPIGCPWTIQTTSSTPGVLTSAVTSGIGDATLMIGTSVNATSSNRTAQLTATATTAAASGSTVNPNRTASLAVNQAPAPAPVTPTVADPGCTQLALNRNSERHGDNIINGSISVLAATTSCTWSTSVDAAWVSLSQGATGRGTGSINYQLQANPTFQSRQATLSVKGPANATLATLTIIQMTREDNAVTNGGSEGGSGDSSGDGTSGGNSGGAGDASG